MSNELKVAIEAAKAGAKIALKYYGKQIKVTSKLDKTVVTQADKETEIAIKAHINSKFPKAKFVAEESGGDRNAKEFWIIDPIDGTRGFIRGIPGWRILIAYYKAGEILLGVSYAPFHDELLYAEKGKGAFTNNNKRAYVSTVKNLKDAFVAFGSPRHFKNKQHIISLIENAGSLRCFEPTSYSDYLLAAGVLDAYVDCYAEIWDAAPYRIIVEEAGGKFTNLEGKPWTFNDRGYISTNGLLHDQVIRILKDA